jgi:hypothetical protein
MTRAHHTLPHRLGRVDAYFCAFCSGLLACSSFIYCGGHAGRYHQRQTERRSYRAFSCQILLEAERTTDFSVVFCLNKSRRPVLMFGEVGETSRIVGMSSRRVETLNCVENVRKSAECLGL